MTLEIVMLWLPSLLISLVSLGTFIFLSFRNRRQIDQLNELARDYAQQRVGPFLEREAQVTRQRMKLGGADHPTAAIDKLRVTWLEAELTALVELGKRKSNYDLLLHGVQPIVLMLNRAEKADADANANANKEPAAHATAGATDRAAAQLHKTRDAISAQNETIAIYRQKIADLDAQGEAAPQFGVALDDVEHNSAELLATIARLEGELAMLQQKLDAAERQSGGAEFLVVSAPTGAGASGVRQAGAAQALLSETEEAYRQSVDEMNRMRDINSRQRHLILQLEKELSLLRTDSTQHDISSEVLNKLRLQLRDYENCTVILEKEADTLRDKIDRLKKIIAHENQRPAAAPASAPPAPSRPQAVAEQDDLAMAEHLTGIADPHTLVAAIVEWLHGNQLPAAVYAKLAGEQIWSSSEGGVDQHSKQILQSIVPDARNPRLDVDEGLLFAFPVLRVLINRNAGVAADPAALQRLERLARIADRWLAQQETLKKGVEVERNGIRDQLAGLLAQYNYVAKENYRVGDKFRSELNDFFDATGFSKIQREVIETMLADFDAQQEIIGKASKLIYTRLKTLVDDLGRVETAQ